MTCRFYIFGVPLNSVRPGSTPGDPTFTFKALEVQGIKNIDGTWCEPDGLLMFFEPAWSESEHQGALNGMSGGPVVVLGSDKPYVVGVLKEGAQPVEIAEKDQGLMEAPNQLRATDSGKLLLWIEDVIRSLRAVKYNI